MCESRIRTGRKWCYLVVKIGGWPHSVLGEVTRSGVKFLNRSGRWSWRFRWAARAEFCGVEESPGAFKDPWHARHGFYCGW